MSRVRFLSFILIKLEAAKQCAKKRKESGADEKDNASNAPSPPPQVKKPKMTDPMKKGSAPNAGKSERQSLFSNTNGFGDMEDMPTPEHKSSDNDSMEDSIVVQHQTELQPGKKVAGGDPFTSVRDVHKLFNGDPDSPSPAPRPDRKLPTKPVVRGVSGLKFDVSVAAHSQGAKQARKSSDIGSRPKEAVKAASPTKVAEGKVGLKQPPTKIHEAASKVAKHKKLNPHGKMTQDHSEVAAPAQQEKEDTNMSGTSVNTSDEQHHEQNGDQSHNLMDTIPVFTPDANGLQATVDTDHVMSKPDLLDDAAVAVQALHDTASTLPADTAAAGAPVQQPKEVAKKHAKPQSLAAGQDRPAGVDAKPVGLEAAVDKGGSVDAKNVGNEHNARTTEENEEFNEANHANAKLSSSTRTTTPGASLSHAAAVAETTSTATVTTTATPQPRVFIITIAQPGNADTDMESICLTFPPTTTTWASFYCSLAMQLPVEDRVMFARATTCKVRVPRQAERKPRVFGFEIKPGAADPIWANVMRMVAGSADEAEGVEVGFCP